MGKEQDLFEAARVGNVALVEKMLSPKNKWAPFSVSLPSLPPTLQRKSIHPNIQDTNGETPLHHASLNGHRTVVELLLKMQASANIPDQKGCYPLHLAAWRGNAEICQILITHGPSVAKVNAQNSESDTALHTAAQYGHTAVVNLLLQHQADPTILNRKRESALDLACQYGRLDTVQLLLAGLRPTVWSGAGQVTTGCSQWADSVFSTRDKSPLHLAARSGHRHVIQALIEAGFNINHKTDDGTALHEASLYGRVDVVRLLLEQGIDVNLLDCANKTALAIVSDQKTIKSQEIESILKEYVLYSTACSQPGTDTEATYDQLPLSRIVAGSTGDSASRENVIGRSSLLFEFPGSLREVIPCVDSEEESIYDRPPAQLRVVIPSIDCNKPLLSSESVQSRSPNTPKKPPRKKPSSQKSVMVKGVDTGKSTSSFDEQCDGVESPEMRCHSNSDNNNEADVNNPVEILQNTDTCSSVVSSAHRSETSRPTDDNDPSNVANNNNRISAVSDTEGPFVSTSMSQCANETMPNSMNCSGIGYVLQGRLATVVEQSPTGARPSGLNMSSLRATCVVVPTSPTHYNQPPTPEHPPPSPMTAILGIQEKINPKDRRRSRDMETITESEYLGGNGLLAPRNVLCPTESQLISQSLANDDKLMKASTNEQPLIKGEEKIVFVPHSDKDPFIGLTKGSTTAAGITARRSSDSKAIPVVSRLQKHDSLGNSGAKRISAPPTMTSSNSRPTGERLETLSETVSTGLPPSAGRIPPVAKRPDKTKSVVVGSSVPAAEQTAWATDDDEMEEWGRIEDIISSIGSGLDADTLVKEFNERMCSVYETKEDESVRSVGDWLTEMNLSQYENTLVANGYDNMDFLGADVLDENDLLEIGVLSSDHREKILHASATLPPVPVPPTDHVVVKDWLSSLQLSDYFDSFVRNSYVDMNRVRKIWEVDLTALIGISRLGHRKRILASLKSETQKASAREDNGFLSSTGRHPDFAELDQLMNWNSPLLQRDDNATEDDISMVDGQRSEDSKSLEINSDSEIAGESGCSDTSQWRHQPESLIKGHCNYTAQYLGSTLVAVLEGTESTKSSICRLKKSSQNIGKIPSIVLSISYKGVKFIDPESKQVICEHEIGNIFCACQDADDLNVFAYITRDLLTNKHYCHVFIVSSTDLATEIILTLGEAFEVAYQMALRENSASSTTAVTDNNVTYPYIKQSYSTVI